MSFLDSFDEPDDSMLVSPSSNRSRVGDDRQQHVTGTVETDSFEPNDERDHSMLERTPAKFNYASALEKLEFLAPTPATVKATDVKERRPGAVFASVDEVEERNDSVMMEPAHAKQQPASHGVEMGASIGCRALFTFPSSSSPLTEPGAMPSPKVDTAHHTDDDDYYSPSLALLQATEKFIPIKPTNDIGEGDPIDVSNIHYEDYASLVFRHPYIRKSNSGETSLQIKLGHNVNETYDSTVSYIDRRGFRARDERMVKDMDLSIEVEKAFADDKSGEYLVGALSSELLIRDCIRENQTDGISGGREDMNVSIDMATNQGKIIHHRPKFRPPIDEYKCGPWDSMCIDDSEETVEANDQPSGYVETMRKSIDCYFSSQLGSLPEGDDFCINIDCVESSDNLRDCSNKKREESSSLHNSQKGDNTSENQESTYSNGYDDDENKGDMINHSGMGDNASQVDVNDTLEYASYFNSSQHPRNEDVIVRLENAPDDKEGGRIISESIDQLQNFLVGVHSINENNPEADHFSSSSFPPKTEQLELENCNDSKLIADSSYSSKSYGGQVPADINDQLDDSSSGSNTYSAPDNTVSNTRLTFENDQISKTKNSSANNNGCPNSAADYANSSMGASKEDESQLAVIKEAESSLPHLDADVRHETELSLEMKPQFNLASDGIDPLLANHKNPTSSAIFEERGNNDFNHSPARLKEPLSSALSSNYLSPISKNLSPHYSCDLPGGPGGAEHATILDKSLTYDSSLWHKHRRDLVNATGAVNEMKSILADNVGQESPETFAYKDGSEGAHLITSMKDSIFHMLSHQPFQGRDDVLDESKRLDQHRVIAIYDDDQNNGSILGIMGKQQMSPDIVLQSKRSSFEEFSSYQQSFNSTSNAFIERLKGAAEHRKREVTSGRMSMERKEQILYEEKRVRGEVSTSAVDEEIIVKHPRKSAAPPPNKFEGEDLKPLPPSKTECLTLRTRMQSSKSSLGVKRKTSNAFRPHPAQNESHVKISAPNVKPPKRLLSGKEASIAKEKNHRNRLQEEQERIKLESTFIARPLPVRTLTRSQMHLAGENLVSSQSVQIDKENKAFIPRSSIRAEKRKSYNLEKAAREEQRRKANIERRHQLLEQTKTEIKKLTKLGSR
ncbi:hypothetical protein ACHAXA_006579 [Cyclostephanos tholiformis]|uniref:ALMS motif domain-containing protein n=1 Tax=Cyclostephanos tholiformis TaxID=382380 RepID=A0ABD3RBN8_9STRA